MNKCKVCGDLTKKPTNVFCSRECANDHRVYMPTVEQIYEEAARQRALRGPEEIVPVEVKVVGQWLDNR